MRFPRALVVAVVAVVGGVALATLPGPSARAATPTTAKTAKPIAKAPAVPRFDHVVEVFLENESATATFEAPAAQVPGLAALKKQGVYLPDFYAVGHASLDNYVAVFGGVQPNSHTETDCLGQDFDTCTFPASYLTLGALLDAKHLSWKVYSEGMDGAPGGHNCLYAPNPSAPDIYQGPDTNGYATRHNPAPWFDSVRLHGGSQAYCQAHNVDLTQLWKDDQSGKTLPVWSFVEPDTCHDGHDDSPAVGGCALDPEGATAPTGVAAIDAWLPGFVHRLTTSPGWDSKSLLVITFDEAASSDTSGCAPCHDGSSGGRIGALLISGLLAHPGTSYTGWVGDHYAMLRTFEAAFGLPTLKSRAPTAAQAALVHDGDPGVRPLTGVWKA